MNTVELHVEDKPSRGALSTLSKYRLVYVASAYSLYEFGLDAAYSDVADVCWWLKQDGVRHYSPILMTHHLATAWGIDRLDGDFWIKYDQPMMDAADALLVVKMPGWDHSKGIYHEIVEFRRLGKPVHFLNFMTLKLEDDFS